MSNESAERRPRRESRFVRGEHGTPGPHPTAPDGVMLPLVRSADPIVVFSSLARAAVPVFATACCVSVSQGTEPLFRLTHPSSASGGLQSECGGEGWTMAAAVSFSVPSELGHDAYSGEVRLFRSDATEPSAASAVARMLVDRAVQAVLLRRMQERAETAEARSADLAAQLISSRTVGEAIGYLVGSAGMSLVEAERLLRRRSRTAQMTLDDYASLLLSSPSLTSREGGVLRPLPAG